MRDFEQDLLATFQGHDIRVHREFYRLPESMLQIAKISKVLHCINNGTIQKYKGCNFDDIEFEENETVEEESDDDEDTDSNDIEDIPTEDAVPSSGKKGVKRKRECTTGIYYAPLRRRWGILFLQMSLVSWATRQAWSDEEKKTLERVFAKFIKEEKVPGKLDIINVVRSEKVFGNYNWKRVKYAVYNIILGRRKKSRFI
ncbi:uncharacterized protein LOC128559626 [Mercenaria mercenaria]|uniref:uncharacterized protein LOC128559626 n=1 Tax=Mercenaria mercenaria TaxID=6596 RepID=UPI00234F3394|nr:uncharacterized protein LOC128559626 [Mercenaria mercenaria]